MNEVLQEFVNWLSGENVKKKKMKKKAKAEQDSKIAAAVRKKAEDSDPKRREQLETLLPKK